MEEETAAQLAVAGLWLGMLEALAAATLPPPRKRRRVWKEHRCRDFYEYLGPESEHGTWAQLYAGQPGLEDAQYRKWFRLSKAEFENLHAIMQQACPEVQHQNTRLRHDVVVGRKRLAMTLRWLAKAEQLDCLAEAFALGKSTAHSVVHEMVRAMAAQLPDRFISFPSGAALQQTMADMQDIAGMEGCAGAVDGCFIPMLAPTGPWRYRWATSMHVAEHRE